MENLLLRLLKDLENRQLNSVGLTARFGLIQILLSKIDRALLGPWTVNVGGIGAILH
jgi:hypothetical protein